MKRFNPTFYYEIKVDATILDDKSNLRINFLQRGWELVAQYYVKKYSCNISFPKETPSSYIDRISFVGEIAEYLHKARDNKEDYRQAFLLTAKANHAIPIIYIREGGKEAILYADTYQINNWEVQKIMAKTGLKVFAI